MNTGKVRVFKNKSLNCSHQVVGVFVSFDLVLIYVLNLILISQIQFLFSGTPLSCKDIIFNSKIL